MSPWPFCMIWCRAGHLPGGDSENQVREVGTDDIGRMAGDGATLGQVKGWKEEAWRSWDQGGGRRSHSLQGGLGESGAGDGMVPRKGRRQAGASTSEGDLGSQWARNSMARNVGDGSWSGRDPKPPLGPKVPWQGCRTGLLRARGLGRASSGLQHQARGLTRDTARPHTSSAVWHLLRTLLGLRQKPRQGGGVGEVSPSRAQSPAGTGEAVAGPGPGGREGVAAGFSGFGSFILPTGSCKGLEHGGQ